MCAACSANNNNYLAVLVTLLCCSSVCHLLNYQSFRIATHPGCIHVYLRRYASRISKPAHKASRELHIRIKEVIKTLLITFGGYTIIAASTSDSLTSPHRNINHVWSNTKRIHCRRSCIGTQSSGDTCWRRQQSVIRS